MSWKTNIQLRDLDADQKIEVTCRSCNGMHYTTQQNLIHIYGQEITYKYLDEIEALITCKRPTCSGKTRIALSGKSETGSFIGGLT